MRSRARQRVFRLDNKNVIHKRKDLLKLKIFVLQKTLLWRWKDKLYSGRKTHIQRKTKIQQKISNKRRILRLHKELLKQALQLENG